jgi:hypothetical protein
MDSSATASELTRLELEHLAFLGPAEFVSIFAKDSGSGAKNHLTRHKEEDGVSPGGKRRIKSSIDDARMRAAGRTNKFDCYVGWFNRVSYLVASTICRVSEQEG